MSTDYCVGSLRSCANPRNRDTIYLFLTLWSHISAEKQFLIEQNLSDFRVIRNNEKRLTVDDYNQIHSECRLFLKQSLKNKTNISTVVITHHFPTFFNYPEKYVNSIINEAFGTEMFNFIEENKTKRHMQSADEKVIAKIKNSKRDSLFFTEDLLAFGSAKIAAKGLERMVEKERRASFSAS